MIGVVSMVEHEVASSLRGAKVIGCIVKVDIEREGYTEWSVFTAWEREDQCGTHRVQVNTDEESMCVQGHYDLSREKALMDMLKRAGYDRMTSTEVKV